MNNDHLDLLARQHLRRIVLAFFSFLVINHFAKAQCNYQIEAGEDFFLCDNPNGGSINLSGSASGDPLFVNWGPAELVDDPTSLNTIANVSSTTSFILNAYYPTQVNLVVNGDFENGNTGFTSDYEYALGILSQGNYAISPNPTTHNGIFSSCPDRTSGTGNMMIVDASPNLDEKIWCQTINVISGTYYTLSVGVTSIFSVSPAELDFSINGISLSTPIMATSNTCLWFEFTSYWQADTDLAEICIVNNNLTRYGNDFALDDILFSPLCSNQDLVQVFVDDLQLSLSDPDDLDCENSEADITASYSSSNGDDFIINWATNDGNIQGDGFDATVTIDQPGTYTFTFFNFETGCVVTEDLVVGGDNTEPMVDAGENIEIDCINTTVELAGSSPDNDSNYTYTWTTSDGNIVSDEDSLNPTVDAAGTYVLQVTNNDSGCTSSSEVEVLSIAELPDAMAISEAVLNCETSMVSLNGMGSTEGDDYSYDWTSSDGNIIGGADGLNPIVDMPGTYTLIVTNSVNGCTQLANVLVEEDLSEPTVEVSGPLALNCIDPTGMILGHGTSSGDNFVYEWSSPDGNIISDVNELNIEVDMAGTYTLLVTNTDNGCTASLPFTMGEDNIEPEIEILASPELNCITTQIDLEAIANDVNSNYTFQWSTSDGNIVAGENSLSPTIDQTGSYQILVTNPGNGCTSLEDIEVSEDISPPEVEVLEPLVLDCSNTTTSLQINDLGSNENSSYMWESVDGNIISGSDSDSPFIDAAGTYTLISTNENNGCTSSLEVVVEENVVAPTISISPPDIITCSNDEIILMANSGGANDSFEWSTANGNFLSDSDSSSPLVNSTGIYELLVTNSDSGCTAIEVIEVFENISEPNVDAGNNLQLTCDLESLNLSGVSNNSGNFSFSWSTSNGSIQNGQNTLSPEVNAPGIYTLLITDESNGCTSSDEVEISQDLNAPNADAGPSSQLDCETSTVLLNASASSSGPDISFVWSTQNGNFLSGQNSLTPEVNQAGTYLLTVTNSSNNCSTVSSVTIDENITPPVLDLGQIGILDCNYSELFLFNQASNMGNLVYTWSSDDGSFLSGQNPGEIIVDEAGEYLVTVVNWDNGCETSAVINISQDIEPPLVEAGLPATLDCTESSLQLNGLVISNAGSLTYEWSTNDGNIVSGEDTLFPMVDQAGTYTLTVVNVENGCEGSSSVLIDQNEDIPVVDIQNPLELNCALTSHILDGSNSSIGAEFTYEWATINGNILSGSNTLMPEINAAGNYSLLITNTDNGCSNIEEIVVGQNIEVPLANGSALGELSCTVETIVLESNTFGASNIEFLWSTNIGNIVGDLNSSTAEVDQAGTYLLTITSLDNQCSTTVEIEVEQDANTPIASIEPAELLNCNVQQFQLDGTNSSQGNNIQFTWSTTDGNFVSGTNSLSPEIDQAGSYTLNIIDTVNGCEINSTVVIGQDIDLPEVDISMPSILSCNIQTTSIGAVPQDPNSNLTYEWTLSDGTILQGAIIDVTNPGVISCTVLNIENGCSDIFITEVFQDLEVPFAQAEVPAIINCNESTSSLDASQSSSGANLTYLWSSNNGNVIGGANTLTPEVDAAGIYTLTISNLDNGCENQVTVEVFENLEEPLITTELPNVINCINDDVELLAEVEGIGNYSYSWSSLDGNILGTFNTSTIHVNAEGNYELFVTNQDNGCTAISSLQVLSDLETPLADAGDNYELTCLETQIQLLGFASSSGPEYEYLWSTVNGNILQDEYSLMPTVDQAAFYTLTVTNTLNGCSSSSTIEVFTSQDNPTVIIEEPEILNCVTESVSILYAALSANDDIEVEWSTTNGNIITGTEQDILIVNQPGIYEVLITDFVNGCTSIEQIEVFQDIENPLVDAGPSGELTCNVKEIELEATGSMGSEFDFQWLSTDGKILNGPNTLNPVVNSPGSYLLTVVNKNNGCTAEDFVLISRNENVPTSIDAIVEEPYCFGDRGSIEFTSISGGEGPYLYSIDNGVNFFSEDYFDQLSSGTYDLLIQDINACRLNDIIVIPEVLPIDVDLIPAIELLYGESENIICTLSNIPQSDIESVAWTPSTGLSCTDCLNPIASPAQDILYSIHITTKNGCETSAQIQFRVDREINVYIPDTFSPHIEDGINDVFMIFSKPGVVNNVLFIQVYDRWGNELYEEQNFQPNDPTHSWDGSYEGKKMNSGVFVYYAVIELVDGSLEHFTGDLTILD